MLEVARRHLSDISSYSLNHNLNSGGVRGILISPLEQPICLQPRVPPQRLGATNYTHQIFIDLPSRKIRVVVSSFFISMLSDTSAPVYCRRLQKLQCEPPDGGTKLFNSSKIHKQNISRGFEYIPEEASGRIKPDTPPLCSLSTLSIPHR